MVGSGTERILMGSPPPPPRILAHVNPSCPLSFGHRVLFIYTVLEDIAQCLELRLCLRVSIFTSPSLATPPLDKRDPYGHYYLRILQFFSS
jgi:hypothetical protein